jgi:hypothetical protein
MNIFTEGKFLFMRDTLGLVHRMEIEDICIKEEDLTEAQIKKREKARRKKNRGIFRPSLSQNSTFLTDS